ncbi:MAG: hypothetical protein VZR13_08615 [Saccharofermentanaceae bacterium]|nr:hypothetical protein [Saccharofermentanaceae bacterium]
MGSENGKSHGRWIIEIGDVKLGKKEIILLVIGVVIIALLIVANKKYPNFLNPNRRIARKNIPIAEEAIQTPETVAPDDILPGTDRPEATIMGQTKIVLTEETLREQYERTIPSVSKNTVLAVIAGTVLVAGIIAFVIVCVRYKNKMHIFDVKLLIAVIILIAFVVGLISLISLSEGYRKKKQEVTFHVYPIEVVGSDRYDKREGRSRTFYYFVYYMAGEREVELQVEQYMYRNYGEPGLYYLISAEHDDKRQYFQLYPASSYVLAEELAGR